MVLWSSALFQVLCANAPGKGFKSSSAAAVSFIHNLAYSAKHSRNPSLLCSGFLLQHHQMWWMMKPTENMEFEL